MSANDGIETIRMGKEPAEVIHISAFSTRGLRLIHQPIRQHNLIISDSARQRGNLCQIRVRTQRLQEIRVELCNPATAAKPVRQKNQELQTCFHKSSSCGPREMGVYDLRPSAQTTLFVGFSAGPG